MSIKRKESIAICLDCYKIKFTEKRKTNQVDLAKVFATSDLHSIVQRFIKLIDTNSVFLNDDSDRILYLDKSLDPKSKNVYAGIIMKGFSGPETLINELAGSTTKKVKFNQKVPSSHFHCLPYFFLLYAEKSNPKEIIFIAQSYRQFGFKDLFEEAFKFFVRQENENITVKIGSLSVARLFEEYVQKGLMKSIRFTKYGLSKNVESVAQGDNLPSQNYTVELKVKSEKGFLGIKSNLKYDDSSFIEQMQIDGFDYSVAHAEILLNGRKRLVNISKPQEFSTSFDITEDVPISASTKLPDFNAVMAQAIDILNNDLIPYV